MANFIVKTVFKGNDLISPIFKRMGKNAQLFGDKASRSFSKASKSATSFGSVFKGVLAAGAVQKGISVIGRGARVATEEFLSFDQSITSASAKFPGMIQRGTKAFNQLGATARKVGAETQFSAADAAGGLDFLAMAGFNAQQAMQLLPGVTNLATIANADLARATDIASDALGAFGLMSKDTAQLNRNFNRVMDVMAKTVTSANTDMEMLFETMKFAGPVATSAGQSIETFNTLAAQMANAGIKGSLAGTALRTAFTNLSAPTRSTSDMMQKLNLNIKDNRGNMRDMIDILKDLRIKTAKMNNIQKTAALNALFGKRAIAGMSVVLAQSDKSLRSYRQSLLDASGTSKAMAQNIRKSLTNRLLELRSAAIELGFKFLEAFVGKGEKGIESLTMAIRQFNPQPIVDGVKDFLRVMEKLLDIVGQVWSGIRLFSQSLGGLESTLGIVATAIVGATTAQWIWNAAIAANPIGLLIGGLAIAAAGITIVANNMEAAGLIMESVWLTIKDAIIGHIEDIQEGWKVFVNFFIRQANKVLGLFTDFQIKFKTDDKEILKSVRKRTGFDARNTDEMQRRLQIADKFFKAAGETQKKLTGSGLTKGLPEGSTFKPDLLKMTEGLRRDIPSKEVSSEKAAAVQTSSFSGLLQIAGAPKGSSFADKSKGAPPINVEMLGAN